MFLSAVSSSPEPTVEVVLRGIGPSLHWAELAGPLADPVLELHDANGAVVATNDNWKDISTADQKVLTDNDLAPTNEAEAAMVSRSAGDYTVIGSGANASTGVALVEIYTR